MSTLLVNSLLATAMKESGPPNQHGGGRGIAPEFLQTAMSSNFVSLCESVPAYLSFPTFSMLKKHICSQEKLKVLQISKNEESSLSLATIYKNHRRGSCKTKWGEKVKRKKIQKGRSCTKL